MGTTLKCKAVSEGVITYHWQFSSTDKEQWTDIPYSNGETLVVRNLPYSEKYRCIASNNAGSTTSNIATIFLMGKLLINNEIIMIFSYLYNRDHHSASEPYNCHSIGRSHFNLFSIC